MQLLHGYDEENFPFIIGTVDRGTRLFLLNVNTQKEVPLINLKDCIGHNEILDIK